MAGNSRSNCLDSMDFSSSALNESIPAFISGVLRDSTLGRRSDLIISSTVDSICSLLIDGRALVAVVEVAGIALLLPSLVEEVESN